jgi:hypothetical protein
MHKHESSTFFKLGVILALWADFIIWGFFTGIRMKFVEPRLVYLLLP